MGKFKKGDMVITRRFDNLPGYWLRLRSGMMKFVDTVGIISNEVNDKGHYQVHGYCWPESALELVESRSSVTIQTSTTDIRVILGKDTFDVWESDSLVVAFTPEEVTEIFTAMKAFK